MSKAWRTWANKKMKPFKGLASVLRSLLIHDDALHIAPCDILLVRADGDCGYFSAEGAFAQLIDSLALYIDQCGGTCRVVGTPPAQLVKSRSYLQVSSINRAHVMATLRDKMRRHPDRLCHRSRMWRDVLQASKARQIIGIQPPAALCQAARELNIPVHDLQHGYIAGEHPYYAQQRLHDLPHQQRPTGFLVWDTNAYHYLNKTIAPLGYDVQLSAHPWHTLLNNRSAPLRAAIEHSFHGFKRALGTHTRKKILLTLTWGLDQYYHDAAHNGIVLNLLDQVIRHTSDRYCWLIRAHPMQITGPDRHLAETYLDALQASTGIPDWRQATNIPMPLLLPDVDLHLTDFSTTTIEASWYGIHTGLLNPEIRPGGRWEHMYAPERARGVAKLLQHTAHSITNWIESEQREAGSTNAFSEATLKRSIDRFLRQPRP